MSFLSNYMTWTEGTETPENYHFWSAMSALAAIVGGKVWSHQGRIVVHPNLYTVLLGPPHSGKTFAKRQAEKIVRAIGDIPMSVETETKESLTRYMRDQCVRTFQHKGETVIYTPINLFLNELSNFLGPNSGHMIDFLTGIWDCADENFGSRTKNKGEDLLSRPYVNLLACTTQEWITTYLKADIIGGGFSRRVIFVNEPSQDDSKRIPRPEWTPDQLRARDSVISYGKVLSSVMGEMVWDRDALHKYDKWYVTRDIPKDPDTRGFHKSKPTLVFKLAPLIALSNAPDLKVSGEDVDIALALLEKSELNLGRVFQGMGRNELNATAQKVLQLIFDSGERDYKVGDTTKKGRWMLEKQIQGMMYKDVQDYEWKDILNHLISTEKIERLGLPGTPVRYVLLLR